MFDDSTKRLIAHADEQNVLFRTLLQTFADHGANGNHLNRLLEDTKSKRCYFSALVKTVIGPIWERIVAPFEMKEPDFECSAKNFIAQFTQLDFTPNIGLEHETRWSINRPMKPVSRYQLEHSPNDLTFNEVLTRWDPYQYPKDPASWRELVAFVSLLKPEDLCGYRILAPGSRIMDRGGLGTIFPAADGLGKRISISWKGVKRPEVDHFENQCLYLVRVYE